MIEGWIARLSRLGRLNLLVAAALVLVTGLLMYGWNLPAMDAAAARLAAWLLGAGLSSLFLAAASPLTRTRRGWLFCLALAGALISAWSCALIFLPELTDYPLTLTWSETSRYYYASLFFSERIYGFELPPTVLHPSRYLLQAVPFLFPGAPLLAHRAWQVFLWLLLPALTAALAVRRLGVSTWLERTALSLAIFLYLWIGPVYYHLLAPVALLLAGFDAAPQRRFGRGWWRNLLVLVAASAWAGISRVNWYPVPALLAATLVLIETPAAPPLRGAFRRSDLWSRPALAYAGRMLGLGLVGMLAAVAAQAGYVAWSGNSAEQFTSSFSSALLWRRLLPNSTYPPGMLLALVLVSLPPLLLIAGRLLELQRGAPAWRSVHPLRLLGLAAVGAVLAAGGLLVSLKIGGGSNLHNVDAYLAWLALVAAWFWMRRLRLDTGPAGVPAGPAGVPAAAAAARPARLLQAGAWLCLALPALALVLANPPVHYDINLKATNRAIRAINRMAAEAGPDAKVLFLSNRHLVTFGQTPGLQWEPEYERVFLMEMAMAGNRAYLDEFDRKLREHEYSLIVAEPLSNVYKGSGDVFGEENNAWVKEVSEQVLCYYSLVTTIREAQIQILHPRDELAPFCRPENQ